MILFRELLNMYQILFYFLRKDIPMYYRLTPNLWQFHCLSFLVLGLQTCPHTWLLIIFKSVKNWSEKQHYSYQMISVSDPMCKYKKLRRHCWEMLGGGGSFTSPCLLRYLSKQQSSAAQTIQGFKVNVKKPNIWEVQGSRALSVKQQHVFI